MPSPHASLDNTPHAASTIRADVYTRVTDQIIRAIEAGADDYQTPWRSIQVPPRFPINALTGRRYRGVNTIALWAEAQLNRFVEPAWGTIKQWNMLGRHVRRGEHAATGVFWKQLDAGTKAGDADTDVDDEATRRWVARAFPLFNECQLADFQPGDRAQPPPTEQRIERADVFIASLDADIRHGGNEACYRPKADLIQMPMFTAFPDPIDYYAVLAHETIHWTGHPSRLARDLSGRFRSMAYAAEELIAELGASFIAADLELTIKPRPDHAAYIDSWLKVMKSDSRAIFAAAGHAQRAADYMHSLQPTPTPAPASRISQPTLAP